MAQFQDIECSGLITAFQFQGGVAAQGVGLTPAAANVALAAGANNNLVLPGLGAPGPGLWVVDPGASGKSITGIETTDVSLLPGHVVTIVNADATNSVAITGLSSGSAVGNKFATSGVIAAATASQFVYIGAAGAGLWYPIQPTAGS